MNKQVVTYKPLKAAVLAALDRMQRDALLDAKRRARELVHNPSKVSK